MRCQVVEEFMSMADGQTVAVKGPHPAMATQPPSQDSAAAGREDAALATAAAAAAKVCDTFQYALIIILLHSILSRLFVKRCVGESSQLPSSSQSAAVALWVQVWGKGIVPR